MRERGAGAAARQPWPALALLALIATATPSPAQLIAPDYTACRLDHVYPAGGRRGTSVAVTFRGAAAGLAGVRGVVIDGPPGVTARDVTVDRTGYTVTATLDIAADAAPGRRAVRVAADRCGMTNLAWFQVGTLPERLEKEPNDAAPEAVTAPVVVNGRIDPGADVDAFKFAAKKGQRVVAHAAAHALDAHGQGRTFGLVDLAVEVTDAAGRVVAESEDALGFDPLAEFVAPADGEYVARVRSPAGPGHPDAVYRLTLGEVPVVTAAFPPGLRRGRPAEVELSGPNVPPGTRAAVPAPPADDPYPVTHLCWAGGPTSGHDLPLARSDLPESDEAEPNDLPARANPLPVPGTVNARFHAAGDADWFRVRLPAGKPVWLDVVAHRYLHSPADTALDVYDAAGARVLASNDDDATADPGYESVHDFKTTDSTLLFSPPAAGDYLVRVTDRNGSGGPRAVYRLSARAGEPGFTVRHFPDAVPVWGPGSTAAFLARLDRLGEMNDDIEVLVEGLPAGWSSSPGLSLGKTPARPNNNYNQKMFLTVTAPASAKVGDIAAFRVVGRARRAGHPLARASNPLTLFYTSDTGFFRVSPVGRAVVAAPQGPWLEADTKELTVPAGGKGTVAVRVKGEKVPDKLPLVVNLVPNGVGCSIGPPVTVPVKDGRAEVPVALPAEFPHGEFRVTVALAWRSDVRVGMPGPCTPLVRLAVPPK